MSDDGRRVIVTDFGEFPAPADFPASARLRAGNLQPDLRFTVGKKMARFIEETMRRAQRAWLDGEPPRILLTWAEFEEIEVR